MVLNPAIGNPAICPPHSTPVGHSGRREIHPIRPDLGQTNLRSSPSSGLNVRVRCDTANNEAGSIAADRVFRHGDRRAQAVGKRGEICSPAGLPCSCQSRCRVQTPRRHLVDCRHLPTTRVIATAEAVVADPLLTDVAKGTWSLRVRRASEVRTKDVPGRFAVAHPAVFHGSG